VRSRLSYFNVTNSYCFLAHAQTLFTLRTCPFLQQDVCVTEFEFAENEFFSNTILSKVYYYE